MQHRRVVGAIAAAALAVGVVACSSNSSKSSNERSIERQVRTAAPARSPFDGLTAASFRVGDRAYDLVIADTETELVQGLRGRASTDPYGGMLFAFPADTDGAFTMADTVAPIEIAFYAADGRLVSRQSMTPCTGTDETCPLYRADRPYRWAIETTGGRPTPDGVLRAG